MLTSEQTAATNEKNPCTQILDINSNLTQGTASSNETTTRSEIEIDRHPLRSSSTLSITGGPLHIDVHPAAEGSPENELQNLAENELQNLPENEPQNSAVNELQNSAESQPQNSAEIEPQNSAEIEPQTSLCPSNSEYKASDNRVLLADEYKLRQSMIETMAGLDSTLASLDDFAKDEEMVEVVGQMSPIPAAIQRKLSKPVSDFWLALEKYMETGCINGKRRPARHSEMSIPKGWQDMKRPVSPPPDLCSRSQPHLTYLPPYLEGPTPTISPPALSSKSNSS